jgi:hypothetical protein
MKNEKEYEDLMKKQVEDSNIKEKSRLQMMREKIEQEKRLRDIQLKEAELQKREHILSKKEHEAQFCKFLKLISSG